MVFKRKNNGGFTLIEVVITIMILGVVLVALISVFIYGFNILSRMKQVAIATQCVQEEIEVVRNMSFDNILTLGTSFTNDSISLLENSQGLLAIEDSEGDDIKKLTVSVLWTHGERQMQKDIATFITREGINKK